MKNFLELSRSYQQCRERLMHENQTVISKLWFWTKYETTSHGEARHYCIFCFYGLFVAFQHSLHQIFDFGSNLKRSFKMTYTAILYRASTGPEQGFPCEVFLHREKPFFIAGNPFSHYRDFPVRKTSQGKPCFHYREGFPSIFMKF